jgi:DNA polymerase III epsilon subunit family exonuclease
MTGGRINASGEFYRLIRPSGEMTRKSIEIHGITPGELQNAEYIDAVLPEFLDFIADSVLVGHFIHIDLRFLNNSLKSIYNMTIRNPAIDTHALHEWLYENSAEFKKYFNGGSLKTDLFSVAEHYGISVNTAHNALYDAYLTAQLLQRFLYFFEPHGITTLSDLIDIGRA